MCFATPIYTIPVSIGPIDLSDDPGVDAGDGAGADQGNGASEEGNPMAAGDIPDAPPDMQTVTVTADASSPKLSYSYDCGSDGTPDFNPPDYTQPPAGPGGGGSPGTPPSSPPPPTTPTPAIPKPPRGPQTRPNEPFNPYLCARGGTHCVQAPPDPTDCLKNAAVGGADAGLAIGSLLSFLAINAAGTPEVEAGEAALFALELAKGTANGALIGGAYGTTFGMIGGLAACPRGVQP